MKIKCPICEKLGYEVTERKLHVVGYHILLFKIHEKIETLDNKIADVNRPFDPYVATHLETLERAKSELKSLLE